MHKPSTNHLYEKASLRNPPQDDSGFFNTNLSKEYAIAAKVQLVEASLGFVFCSAEERRWLQARTEGQALLGIQEQS